MQRPHHSDPALNRPCLTRSALIGALFLACCLSSCSTLPSWHSSPLTSILAPSPNRGERRFDLVVLHHTGQSSFAEALASLTNPASGVSAHYLISRDGEIAQLVDERDRAWHAGIARWGPIDDVNSASLGIELDNNGNEPFGEAQIAALLLLLADVTQRYGIDPRNIVGHADVAPARKSDPSRFFPWGLLAERGFGLRCADVGPTPGPSIAEADALRLIGYQVTDAPDLVAARHAFKLHFASVDDSEPLDAQQSTLLACIARAATKRRARQPAAAAGEEQ